MWKLSSVLGIFCPNLFLLILSWPAQQILCTASATAFTFSNKLPPSNKSTSRQHQHSSKATCLSMSSYQGYQEDLYGAIYRKEQEMIQLKKQHQGTSDPLQIAMGYIEESEPKLRLAKALRRVHEQSEDEEGQEGDDETGGNTLKMRRGCFVADIKRKSLSAPGEKFANFADSGMVAEAMIDMGCDCVFINVDYNAYGGDVSELRSAVRAVRKKSETAAVVMKDIIVDEIQIALAKDAGADAVVLMASVLGPALPNFLDLCTVIGIEALVEVHTKNEIEAALETVAQNLLVTNYDRVSGQYFDDQAERLAGMFPGSGPIVALACGGIESPDQVRQLLCDGYDGVVVGRAIMGNAKAPEFIKAVRDRALLPAEFAGWGLDDVDVDMDGTFTTKDGKRKKITDPAEDGDEDDDWGAFE